MRTKPMLRTIAKFGLAMPCLFLATATIAQADTAQTLPRYNFPTVELPVPNGYDTFQESYKLLKDSQAIGDAFNVNVYYAGDEKPDWLKGTRSYSLEETEKLVKENLPAIRKLREGLSEDCLTPAHEYSDDDDYQQMRELARLLTLDGYVLSKQGKYDKALKADLDAMEFGGDLTHGSGLIGRFVGMAVGSEARQGIHQFLKSLPSDVAAAGAARLAKIDADRVSLADSLTAEKYQILAELIDLYQPSNKKDFAQLINLSPDTKKAALPIDPPQEVVDNCNKYYDAQIARASLIWPKYLATPEPSAPPDHVADAFFDEFVRAKLNDNIALTKLRFLETQLALQAYKSDISGTYPSSLNELLGYYLPAIPIDPFTDNQPLKYFRKGGGYVLYSVGQDGVDDGGVTNETDEQIKLGQANTDMNAKGDIVVTDK